MDVETLLAKAEEALIAANGVVENIKNSGEITGYKCRGDGVLGSGGGRSDATSSITESESVEREHRRSREDLHLHFSL